MDLTSYYKRIFSKKEIASGAHRDAVGGIWDEMGKHQFDYLVGHGLRPDMRLLDVGCGSLRGGVHFIRYLADGNYYGLDVNESLLDAGFNEELPRCGLQQKLPRTNLIVDDHFKATRFGVEFDFAIAQSVFTHLPLNNIRVCMIEISKCMKRGGKFFATFFESPSEHLLEEKLLHSPGDIVTYPDQDPFHYKASDFNWCISGLPWKIDYLGEWGHPRAQKIICFVKV